MNSQEVIDQIEGITIELSHEKILQSYDLEYLDTIREESEHKCRPTWGPEGIIQTELWRHGQEGYWNGDEIMLRTNPERYFFPIHATHSVKEWFEVFKLAYRNRTDRGRKPNPTIQDEIPNPLPPPIVLQIRDGIITDKSLIHTLSTAASPSTTQTVNYQGTSA